MNKILMVLSAVAATSGIMATSSNAFASGWVRYPVAGCATDIASTRDANYVIGCEDGDALHNHPIFRSVGHGAWTQLPGNATQIAAQYWDSDYVSLTTVTGTTYHWFMDTIWYEEDQFREYANDTITAHSIAQWNFDDSYTNNGGSGEWMVGGAEGFYGWNIYYRINTSDGQPGTAWTQAPGQATQVAVDQYGYYPWAINNQGTIFKWNRTTNAFDNAGIGGCATDIAVYSSFSNSDDIWVVGCGPSYQQPYEYTTNGGWVEHTLPTGINAKGISTSANGDTLAFDVDGQVWYYQP